MQSRGHLYIPKELTAVFVWDLQALAHPTPLSDKNKMPALKYIESPEEPIESLALLFKALGDPARLRILNLLAQKGEMCNCHFEKITAYGNSKISRHLSYLKQVGLLQTRREGLWVYYSLKPSEEQIFQQIHQILDQFPEHNSLFRHDIQQADLLLNQSESCS